MKTVYDLAQLSWTLTGWAPYQWCVDMSMELGNAIHAELAEISAPVPGSVQEALRQSGILPDWNSGLNARECEWVENRHWCYETHLPDLWIQEEISFRLRCLGLDYSGWIVVNGQEVDTFQGSLCPYVLDLTPYLRVQDNILRIIFDCPPRWLGQIGFTSQIHDWKPRFNYGWDWTPRLVQIGIWDSIFFEASDGQEIVNLHCTTDTDSKQETGVLSLQGQVRGEKSRFVRLLLHKDSADDDMYLEREEFTLSQFAEGITWAHLPIERWWPNGQGAQPLYTLTCQLLDEYHHALDTTTRRIGFLSVQWTACEGAPPQADPWICIVNNRPLFLQGVNWTPIRPNFADVPVEEYRKRLQLYHDLGCNIVRVWGGAYLEKECFYDLCDELGLLVWQEFPLSSSGLDNWPPEEEHTIVEIAAIAHSYIERRQHHVALIVWCGGNELQGALNGHKIGIGKPIDSSHPLIQRLQQTVQEYDPRRRFLPTSSSGPRFDASADEYGKGLHWDVHGPWRVEGTLGSHWTSYWHHDDALFRSEIGTPGASPVDIIRAFKGRCHEIPGTIDNSIWRRSSWWIEWPEFQEEYGREPHGLEEYVLWSQNRQARSLAIAARACKERFPRCGGFLIWMGHDSFPCTSNTAILDFYGRPKPAALALAAVFHNTDGEKHHRDVLVEEHQRIQTVLQKTEASRSDRRA